MSAEDLRNPEHLVVRLDPEDPVIKRLFGDIGVIVNEPPDEDEHIISHRLWMAIQSVYAQAKYQRDDMTRVDFRDWVASYLGQMLDEEVSIKVEP